MPGIPLPRLSILAGLALASLLAAESQTLARSASFNRTFNTPKGTFTETGSSSFTPSTRVFTKSESLTGPLGNTRSRSYTSAPDGHGGVTVTRSFTGVAGQTHTSTRTFGP